MRRAVENPTRCAQGFTHHNALWIALDIHSGTVRGCFNLPSLQGEASREQLENAVMAKNGSAVRGGSGGRVKVRLLEFELDGSDATLEESMRSLTAALTRSTRTMRVVSDAPAGRASNTGLPASTEVEVDETDETDEEVEQATAEDTSRSTTSPRRTPPKKPPRPAKVIDLDLGNGDASFASYCIAKNPKTQVDKYVLIGAWLREHRGINEITIDHVHTVYKHMSWKEPDDLVQVLRDLKRRNEWFDKGKAPGSYAINGVGLSKAQNMNLPS